MQTDIAHALRNLSRWTRPRRRSASWGLRPARARVHPEPLGVALILGPWNYPFQLLFSPLVGALAAGNCVCLKPSEFAPAASRVTADIVREAFEPGHVTVVEGDVEVARSLVDLDFDHIFFTGSTAVGRQVMAAAANHLTPVTLELGGKCPCVVCPDARIEVAVRRIAWGKFLNAGQTCVAPDHVFVHSSVKDRFLSAMKEALTEFFGPDPRQSADFGRIVNRSHFERVKGYLGQGEVVFGGQTDADDRFIAPTLLVDPAPASAVMTDEIFGPVLPVLSYDRSGRVARRAGIPAEAPGLLPVHRGPGGAGPFPGPHRAREGSGSTTWSTRSCPRSCPSGGSAKAAWAGIMAGPVSTVSLSTEACCGVRRDSTRALPTPPARVTLRTLKRAYKLHVQELRRRP